MNLDQYQEITGLHISSNRQAAIYSQMRKSQRILESMLGYTLDPDEIDHNYYTETGKTTSELGCSCCMDEDPPLSAPDAVVFAYRLFPYNKNDKYLHIDPCSEVHAVKLVKDGVTYRTLEAHEYRAEYDRGIIRYLEQNNCWCSCNYPCNCVQLAVDADWLWAEGQIPSDLLDIQADMVTYYSDQKKGIKSETLGPHSYTRFDGGVPEELDYNLSVIKRYAGPLGSVTRTITI